MTKPIEDIKQWVVKGDHDLGTAKVTFLHIPEYLDTITFHCQQAIEKYLKAFLIFNKIEFKFSHDLVYLLDLIVVVDNDFEIYYNLFAELQSYAVEVRYPNEIVNLTPQHVEHAILIASQIRELITTKMNISIEHNDIIDE